MWPRAALCGLLAVLSPASDATAGDPGLTLSPDGTQLRDAQARLRWPRCVAGMDWIGGHCAGKPLRLTQAEAEIFAHEYARESGRHYRLPTVPELRRLSELMRLGELAGTLLVPLASSGEWLWTSSPQFAGEPGNQYRYDNVMKARDAALVPPSPMPVPRTWAASLRTGAARSDFARAAVLPVLLVLVDSKGD